MDPVTIALVTSVLASVFGRNDNALNRFMRRFLGERVASRVTGAGSTTAMLEELTKTLLDEDLLDAALTAMLKQAGPQDQKAIQQIRQRLTAPDDAPTAAPAPSADVAKLDSKAKARARFTELLAKLPPPSEPPTAWVEAAALAQSFNPLNLENAAGAELDGLARMVSVVETQRDGRWSLTLEARRAAIRRIVAEKRLKEAFSATRALAAGDPPSAHLEILAEIVERGGAHLSADAETAWLSATQEIADWFAGSGFEPLNADGAATLADARDRIEPLRELVGTHFRGREEELQDLRAHVLGDSPSAVRQLVGVGGMGKSALLGKFLLEMMPGSAAFQPWVYLDCDRPEVDLTNLRGLVELIARNLGLLMVGQGTSAQFYELEAASAGDLAFVDTAEAFKDLSEGALVGRLRDIVEALPGEPALVLVIDTFEQAQVRGAGTLAAFAENLDTLLKGLPFLRVIIAGRGDTMDYGDPDPLRLGDLDHASADEVLKARGIRNAAVRERIIEVMGASPLTLRLAGELFRKAGDGAIADLQAFNAQARGMQIQELLYTRILGHIADEEVRRLAHPGLVVRRVTVGVIIRVLAESCDLQDVDAEALFQRLPQHVSLFARGESTPEEGEALVHRPDVRRMMLAAMLEDPARRGLVRDIHERAAAFYSDRTDQIGRGEALYHRLMLDRPWEALDGLWREDLMEALDRAWEEPMPEMARQWLGVRLGRGDSQAHRQADWEASALRRARSSLDVGRTEEALAVLAERPERLTGGQLAFIEIAAWRAAGDASRAAGIAESALNSGATWSATDSVSLLLEAGEARLLAEDTATAREHALRAAELARGLGDMAARLRALDLAVRASDAAPDTDSAAPRRALEEAFLSASLPQLRDNPDLTEKIVRGVGIESTAILTKAAKTFGDHTGVRLFSPDIRQLEGMLRHVADMDRGGDVLANVATAVGLPRSGFDLTEVAANAVKFNRQGTAVAALLNAFGEDHQLRSMTLDMF